MAASKPQIIPSSRIIPVARLALTSLLRSLRPKINYFFNVETILSVSPHRHGPDAVRNVSFQHEPALTRLPACPAILKTSTVCECARKKSSFCREAGVTPELGVLRLSWLALTTGDLDF